MKTILLSAFLSIFLFDQSIYDFKVTDIDNSRTTIDFSAFKGKKILIVNTACKSPYTFQLEELEKLYKAYNGKLVIVAFPAGDDFGDQDFNKSSDIRDFCRYTYNITFPVTEKTTVIGSMRHPVFNYLIEEAKKLGMDEPVIKWNFTKFLLDENGQLLKVFPADVTPMSTEITSYLNKTRNWSPN